MSQSTLTIRKTRQRDGWRYGLWRDDVMVEGGFITWAEADRARDEWLLQEQLEREDKHGDMG